MQTGDKALLLLRGLKPTHPKMPPGKCKARSAMFRDLVDMDILPVNQLGLTWQPRNPPLTTTEAPAAAGGPARSIPMRLLANCLTVVTRGLWELPANITESSTEHILPMVINVHFGPLAYNWLFPSLLRSTRLSSMEFLSFGCHKVEAPLDYGLVGYHDR